MCTRRASALVAPLPSPRAPLYTACDLKESFADEASPLYPIKLPLMSESEEDVADNPSEAGAKPKRWSWNATEAYFVNILIKTCCEVVECGKTMSMPEIHCDVMTIWHRRFAFISQYSLDLIIIIYLQ
jgi:hypothetical protein